MRRLADRLRCCGLAVGVLLAASEARAELELGALIDSARERSSLSVFRVPGSERISALVRLRPGEAAPPGLIPLAPGLAAFEGSLERLEALRAERPGLGFFWTRPRPLLVDRASSSLRAAVFRNATGATGRGVVVGIVDSGLDLEHFDLQQAGGTRVSWLFDLSRPPAGRQPELEARYSCGQARPCAVFSAADIDELRANDTAGDLPGDSIGHGTHVASLAAGNGAASPDRRYAGVAPEASLIVVRATRSGVAGVYDADILLATRFVFDRAAELGRPAVVNLSLGSDFGNHDGSSLLEQGLASFVGEDRPGRAIVVAAGNSGSLITGLTAHYPEPLGVHTELHVAPGAAARVPLLTLPGDRALTSGSLSVWIAGRPGDRLAVGLDGADGALIAPVEPGRVASKTQGALTINLANGLTGSGSAETEGANAALLLVDGEWPRGASFAVRFEDNGSPRLWVESATSAAPSGPGALFPRATREGTITVPASSPALIAVGATVNRLDWIDHEGEPVVVPAPAELVPEAVTEFSSAGPNADGRLKPDIVAPGQFVVGAMARAVDPRAPGVRGGMFAPPAFCAGAECLVVDDAHAVSSGTSMAAPLVSGAIALLFERKPDLTQPELRGLLQSGARPLSGAVPLGLQAGPGTLDLERTLEALDYLDSSRLGVPDRANSFVVLGASYAHPDPEWPLAGLIVLRDADGKVADGFDAERLGLSAEPSARVEPPRRIAPGAFEFAVFPRARSGGRTLELRVSFDGVELERLSVPIAVDRWVASDGYAARGGCSLAAPGAARAGWLLWLVAGLCLRRRAQSRVRYTVQPVGS